jgi:recombination protein RecR
MVFPSSLLENAVNELSKLPGVGKKTALRYVLHLLKKDEEDVLKLTHALERLRQDLKFCKVCHNVADGDTCSICANPSRKKELVCVVENLRDLLAIENTLQYQGSYHVLGGLISPLDGVGPDQLYLQALVNRVNEGSIQEIILALSPTIQGDTTSFYLQKQLSDSSVKITAISRGVAFGGELEYTDELTLARSIANRMPIGNYVQ